MRKENAEMSKFVAGVIGWGLSIVWTAFVFCIGLGFGYFLGDASRFACEECEHGGLYEV